MWTPPSAFGERSRRGGGSSSSVCGCWEGKCRRAPEFRDPCALTERDKFCLSFGRGSQSRAFAVSDATLNGRDAQNFDMGYPELSTPLGTVGLEGTP